MPASRFLQNVSGALVSKVATVVSAGAANDGDVPALDALGKFDASLMPIGFGQNTRSVVASEALAAGDFVNIHDNAGTPNVRKADATTNARPAHGFVIAAFASSATAVVYTSGNIHTTLTGMTSGARQYLATTAGARTATAPSTASNSVQMLGYASSATSMIFEPEEPILLA